ncbi:MAG: DUF503 domain-containing protein [Synergistaceae bacterium]|jgi:uncharacterized protein YlxP (DUF503 family)|nr:DUF503 domain-containing protein [Synergistaceae bacterium]
MRAWLGVVMISIEIPCSGSLKDRRQVVRSLTDRIRRHFNASVSDLGPDSRNRADLAAAYVGSSHQETETRMGQFRSFLDSAEETGEFVILDIEHEVFGYGDV